jgi:hypothetical protein
LTGFAGCVAPSTVALVCRTTFSPARAFPCGTAVVHKRQINTDAAAALQPFEQFLNMTLVLKLLFDQFYMYFRKTSIGDEVCYTLLQIERVNYLILYRQYSCQTPCFYMSRHRGTLIGDQLAEGAQFL